MTTQLELGRITFKVTFARIGRDHSVPPLETTVDDGPIDAVAQQLAEAILRYASSRIRSSDPEVSFTAGTDDNPEPLTSADLRNCIGTIIVGGFRPAGTFVVEAVSL